MQINSQFNKRQYQRYFVNVSHLYEKKEIVVYTGLVLSLFAIAFFGVFALRPTVVTISSLLKEIETKKKTEQQLQTKINNLRQAQVNYAKVADSIYVVNQALPPDPALSDLIYPVEILAQRSNLKLDNLGYTPVNLQGKRKQAQNQASSNSLEKIEFSANLKGNYEDLYSFLNNLERTRRIILLDSFNLSRSLNREGEATSITLNLTSESYFLPKEVK